MSKIALRRYNAEINDMIDQERVEEAIAHCLHILNSYPKYVETYRLLGKAYLESKQYENAADVFQRVLSSHPDDFVANVGMSIIGESNEDYDSAIHYMERAFEEQPSNNAIQEEMKRLFNLRDGVEPTKVRLTRGALARMYVHGNLYDQAVAELLSIINESPQRLDLLTILAETYFIQNMNTEAADICMTVLNDLPYCYLSNRIMYLILIEGGREDQAQMYFSRWVELDPYAAFISPPAYKSEDIADNTIEIDLLEKEIDLAPIEEQLFGTESEDEEKSIDKEIVSEGTIDEPPTLLSEDSDEFESGDDIPGWLFGDDEGKVEESEEQVEEEAGASRETVESFDDLFKDTVEEKEEIASSEEEVTPVVEATVTEGVEEETEDDWLSSLEKVTSAEKDTWPSLLESEEKPVINTGSLELEDAEDLDWLSDLVDEDEESEKPDWEMISDTIPSIPEGDPEVSTEPDVFTEAEETAEEDSEDQPDWMRSVDEVEDVVEDSPQLVEEAGEDLPSWLKPEGKLTDEETTEEEAHQAEETADEIPAWMKSENAVDGPEEGLALEEPKDEFEKLEEEADQAWLNSLAETIKSETAEEAPMPDWLKQINKEKGVESDDKPISIEDAEDITTLPEDDLPEWLKELKEEEFGERSAIDALINEEEQEQVFIEEEEPKLTIQEPDVKEVEDEQLSPEQELAGDNQSKEEEIPDWMQALKGIAEDIPEVGGTRVLSEEEVFPSEKEVIELKESDIPFDLKEEIDDISEIAKIEDDDEIEDVLEELIEDETPLAEQEIKPAGDSDWVPEVDLEIPEEIIEESVEEIVEDIIEEVEDVFEVEPEKVELLDDARKFLQDDDLDKAEESIKKLIRKGKNIPEVIEVLEKGLADHPINITLWQLLGDAFMRQEKLADAMEAYTNAEGLLR